MRFVDSRHVVVVGLGDTGLATVRWLLAHGARVTVADSREDPPRYPALERDFPSVSCRFGAFTEQTFADAELLVVSPGVPLSLPAITDFIRHKGEVLGDIELFARAIADIGSKVIAITGSNGKSTVTTLVGHLCQEAGLRTIVAGNIGLPVLEALLTCETEHCFPDVWVLELSSFQLEATTSLNADASVVLNISEDHLDRYNDLLDYAHSKTSIFNGHGVQVLNHDDPLVRAMARTGRQIRWFSLRSSNVDYGLQVRDNQYWLTIDTVPVFEFCHMPLHGLHNAANVLAALALVDVIGINRTNVLDSLITFRGLPHRVEFVDEIHHVTYIDDSKGTNVGATVAALTGMASPVVLIAGGEGKQQDFRPLYDACLNKVRAVVLIGRDAPLIDRALDKLMVPRVYCETLEQATHKAATLAQAGDTVLLSPACASYDMFVDYKHRSRVFVAAVQQIKAGALA